MAPSQSGRVWRTSSSPGFDPRTFQPVAGRYTDSLIPIPLLLLLLLLLLLVLLVAVSNYVQCQWEP